MARWRSRKRSERRRPIALLAAATAFAASAGAGSAPPDAAPSLELRFARHGAPVAVEGIDALQRVAPSRPVRVFEPYEGKEIVFEAFRFDAVLDAVYSPSWREEEEILFTCRDGYQPTLPVQRILGHEAWLAYRRVDRADFTIDKLESGSNQSIRLAPFYLIWENLDDAAVRDEGDYGWPYQLVGIDLIRTRERFPKMIPPEDASADAVAGFTAFRVYCSRCHAINGEGGTIGPELNEPVSPVEVRDDAWLHRWIDDPSAILPTARMPRFDPNARDRERTIDRIIAYLRVMARARSHAVADEPAPGGM